METKNTQDNVNGIIDSIDVAGNGKIRYSAPIDGQSYASFNVSEAPGVAPGSQITCSVIKSPTGHTASNVRHN